MLRIVHRPATYSPKQVHMAVYSGSQSVSRARPCILEKFRGPFFDNRRYGQFFDSGILDGRIKKISFELNADNTVSALVPHFWSTLGILSLLL